MITLFSRGDNQRSKQLSRYPPVSLPWGVLGPASHLQVRSIVWMSNLASKLGQIGPKWDKFGTFKDQFLSQIVLKLIFKIPRFVPLGVNLTQYVGNTDSSGLSAAQVIFRHYELLVEFNIQKTTTCCNYTSTQRCLFSLFCEPLS